MATENLKESERLEGLIQRPTESLSVELKQWIDPTMPEGIAKIARGCMAMRNNNGGVLLIGFDDSTGRPDSVNRPKDVHSVFHTDVIQGIVSKYAFTPFEVTVRFASREGQDFPVISIPGGVTLPVPAKKDLREPQEGKTLIREHAVYVRSLNSNGTVSTTEARCQDWERLIGIFLDNREADIGRFLRRHLLGADPLTLQQIFTAFKPPPSADELTKEFMDGGQRRFEEVVKERKLELPLHGAFEAAFIVTGDFTKRPVGQSFLNLVMSSNPRYTGWPLWLDSRGFVRDSSQPYVYKDGWEAFMTGKPSTVRHIDFWRIEPAGRFYHRRAFEDDTSDSSRTPEPLTALDFGLVIWRTSEAIAVGLAFAKALNAVPEKTTLQFGFRWSGMKNRLLCSWVDPSRDVFAQKCEEDAILSTVSVPAEVAESSIFQFVHKAIQPLFLACGGVEIGTGVVEELTSKMLGRRG